MLRIVRNVVITFFLFWSAGIGVLMLGIINALSSLALKTGEVFLYGSLGGIAIGSVMAVLLFFAVVRRLRRYKHLFFIIQGARTFLRNRKF
ncbi:MAG TPA: hypothetical protein VJT83_02650 [Chitinophagaceae bacterium]|nr:hypothetical protein [Chitinophagaceae bacterium]